MILQSNIELGKYMPVGTYININSGLGKNLVLCFRASEPCFRAAEPCSMREFRDVSVLSRPSSKYIAISAMRVEIRAFVVQIAREVEIAKSLEEVIQLPT